MGVVTHRCSLPGQRSGTLSVLTPTRFSALSTVAFACWLASCSPQPAPRGPALLHLVDVAVGTQQQAREHCEITGDFRESIVLTGGQEIALAVRVPTSGTLEYSVASRAPTTTPVDFELQIESEDHRVLLHSSPQTATGRWVPHEVDLGPFAGETVVIHARAAPTTPGQDAAVCWGQPVIAMRGRPAPLVVVALLNTVRADRLALYGGPRPNTPGLEALAHDGLVFDDMASDAPWTRASVTTLFTGQSSLMHGTLSRDAHLDPRWTTIAQRLQRAGYRTVALSSNPNVLPFWGFAPGFDRFVDLGAEAWIENSDAAVVLDAGLAALDAAGPEPLFLYLHLNDAHAPYDPPPFEATALLGRYDAASPGKTLTAKATSTEVDAALARYDAEIAYLDEQLGRFDDELRQRHRYEDALLVVVGDHGEEFLDHGNVYHGHTLFREMLSVPLLVKLPGNRGAGTRVATPATMRDVLPTVLATLGLPHDDLPGRVLVAADGKPTDGTSLPRFATTDMDYATAYAVESDGLVLIRQTRPFAGSWIFEHRTDPHERTNLAASAPLQKTVALQKLLDEHLLPARSGWHVRACGGAGASTAAIHIASGAPFVHVERVDLEDDDRVDVAAAANEITWTTTLTPQTHQEESFGKLVPVTRADHDEIVFANPGPLELRYEGGADILVGGAAHPRPSGTTTITLTDADAPAVFAPACPTEPALLVWHAGPADAGAPADPDLERRLKAIGYLQ